MVNSTEQVKSVQFERVGRLDADVSTLLYSFPTDEGDTFILSYVYFSKEGSEVGSRKYGIINWPPYTPTKEMWINGNQSERNYMESGLSIELVSHSEVLNFLKAFKDPILRPNSVEEHY